jgi:hypothetical protein
MPPRSRDQAGSNETADIAAIVAAIHTRSPAGVQLTTSFKAKFGTDIIDARQRVGGNRATHYDFQVQLSDGSWKNVEHKGCKDYVPIPAEQTPWAAGVQFHNGGCEKYNIGRIYAKLWYDKYIASGVFAATWAIAAAIPTFEDWFAKDARSQGDPRTPFGIELKEKVRAAGAHLRDYRAAVNADFQLTPADVQQFKDELLPVLNAALQQKDYWLTIHGDPAGAFHCAWYPPFAIGAIKEIAVRRELDIHFDITCDQTSFGCLLRWGKGAGFSNIRIDAR